MKKNSLPLVMDAPPPTYRQEEIQEILQLAIARQGNDDDELSRHQLLEIAQELGITPEILAAAEADWLTRQRSDRDRQAFHQYRREQLQQKAIRFAIVNGFLISLDWLSGHQLSWSLYPLFAWGLLLTLNTWRTTQTQGEDYEQAFLQWQRRTQLKQSWHLIWQKVNRFLQQI